MNDSNTALFEAILGSRSLAETVCEFLSSSAVVPTKTSLKKIRGVGERKADMILSCIDLSGRYILCTRAMQYTSPASIASRLAFLKYEQQENLVVITLDSSNHELGMHKLTKGTLGNTLASPREVFKKALEDNAAAVVIAHNHPSGNCEASNEDKGLTRVIAAAGKIMDIPLLDHIVVSKAGFTSIRKEMPELFEKRI